METKKFFLLLDSSVLFNNVLSNVLFSLNLNDFGGIVVPRAVFDEIRSKSDCHLLENFSETQTSQAKKRENKLLKAIKIWSKLVKKVRRGDWVLRENYKGGIQNHVKIEARKNNLHLSGADLRILSTALYLKGNGGTTRDIILLTLDKELAILARKEGVKVPDFLFDLV